MNQDRLKKMNSKLIEIVSSAINELTQEIQSDFGLITVNEVKLAKDISYLDIFVSSIKNKELLCKTLAGYAQDVKEHINNQMPLRKTPIVRFRYDSMMEDQTFLLNKINALDYVK